MSRNLGTTCCHFCKSDVELLEPSRPVRKEEIPDAYHHYYVGKLDVAEAWCPQCEAKYLAWTKTYFGYAWHGDPDAKFVDLSFRSTFDDEPGFADLPKYDVEHRPVRTGDYSGSWKKFYDDHPELR